MNISIDLTGEPELKELGEIVETLNDVVADRWLIVGATARDLILHYAHRLPIARKTVDLDIGVAIASWQKFDELRRGLIARGALAVPNVAHRLRLRGWSIDVVPFGGVEHDGVIAWPPRGDTEMSVLGFTEAITHATSVILPDDVIAAVASPPALLLLKLMAWDDRHHELPRHDAYDIRILLDSYSREWNVDHLYDDGDDLLQRFGYDNVLAGAALLARDARAIAERATAERIAIILEREASGDTLVLAADMSGRVEENLSLLEAVRFGFL
ncbi:MAG: hypothetical protein JWO97_1740 [Acidobacteria bacterium]|nr:hypothetical protein [Acidobacteriota bacterium]